MDLPGGIRTVAGDLPAVVYGDRKEITAQAGVNQAM